MTNEILTLNNICTYKNYIRMKIFTLLQDVFFIKNSISARYIYTTYSYTTVGITHTVREFRELAGLIHCYKILFTLVNPRIDLPFETR